MRLVYVLFFVLIVGLSLYIFYPKESNEEFLTKVKKVMKSQDYFEVELDHLHISDMSTLSMEFRAGGSTFWIESSHSNLAIQRHHDELLQQDEYYEVTDISDHPNADHYKDFIDFLANPFLTLELFEDRVEIEGDGLYDRIEYKLENIDRQMNQQMNYLKMLDPLIIDSNLDQMYITDLSIIMYVERKTNKLSKMEVDQSYINRGKVDSKKETYDYQYTGTKTLSNKKINLPYPLTDEFVDGEDVEEIDEKQQEEAVDYLTSVIHASIFQDEDKALANKPKSLKKADIKRYKETYREKYYDSLREEMAPFFPMHEPLDLMNEVTDAYLEALNKTKFEVLSKKQKKGKNVVLVTLAIYGMKESELMKEMAVHMKEETEKQDVSNAKVLEESMRYLIDNYQDIDIKEEPVEVIVEVAVKGTEYFIIDEEVYLDAFIQ